MGKKLQESERRVLEEGRTLGVIYPVCVEAREVKNRIVECRVREHVVRIDQPRSFGADDTAPTPPEMLAISLGSCVVSTLQFLAYQRKVSVKDIVVRVEGQIDFSRAMGLGDAHRAGFEGLRVEVRFDADLSAAEKRELLAAAFRCGASIDAIEHPTPVTYELLE